MRKQVYIWILLNSLFILEFSYAVAYRYQKNISIELQKICIHNDYATNPVINIPTSIELGFKSFLFDYEITNPFIHLFYKFSIGLISYTNISELMVLLILFGMTFYVIFLKSNLRKESNQLKVQSNLVNQQELDYKFIQNQFQLIFDTSHDAIIILNDTKIMNNNISAEKLFLAQKHDFIDKTPFDFSPVIQPDGSISAQKGKLLIQEAKAKGSAKFEWQHKRTNDELFLAEVTLSTYCFEKEIYTTAVIRDITAERTENEELIRYRLELEEILKNKTKEIDTYYKQIFNSNEELLLMNQQLKSEIQQHLKTHSQKKALEEKLNMFIAQSSDGIQIINHEGIFETWNNSMYEITGLKSEDVIGRYFWDIEFNLSLEAEKNTQAYQKIKNSYLQNISNIEEVKNTLIESNFIHKTLGEKVIQTTIFPIQTDSGNYVGRISRDITHKKRIEDELKKSKLELEILLNKNNEKLLQLSERFNEIYNNSNDAIMFVDINENGHSLPVFDINKTTHNYFDSQNIHFFPGIQFKQVTINKNYINFINSILPKILAGETVIHDQNRNISGKQAYWQTTYIPVKNQIGEVYRFASFTRNTTSEMENLKNSAIIRTAIDSWPYDIWIFDKNGKILIQNVSAIENWGYFIEKHYSQIPYHEAEKSKLMSAYENALLGKITKTELTSIIKKTEKHYLVNINPIILPNKELNGFIQIVIDITDRKRAEKDLSVSEQKYRELVENANSIILRWTPEGTITYINEYGQIFFDYSADELIGQNVTGTIVPELDVHGTNLRQLMQDISNNPYLFEHNSNQNRCRDGRLVWIDWTNKVLLDEGGKIKEIFSIGSNITERVEMEKALILSEKKFSTIFQESPIPLSVSELESGLFIEVNNAFLKLVNANSFDQIVGKTSLDLGIFQMNERLKIRNAYLQNEHEHVFEMQLICMNGDTKLVECNSVAYEFENTLYVLENYIDITQRKVTEQLLKESETKYRTAFNTSRDAISISTKDGIYIDINESFTRFCEYNREEIIGLSSIDLNIWVNQTDREDFVRILDHKGSVDNREFHFGTKSGIKIVLLSASYININQTQHIITFVRDISESKALQNSIALNEQKFRTVFNSSKDGIVLVDENMTILDINFVALKNSQYSRSEIIGRYIMNFLKEDAKIEIDQKIHKLLAGESIENFVTEIQVNNGKMLPLEISANTMQLEGQNLFLFILRDISERKQMEKLLLNSVINTEEQERLNFSQELHDGLGPIISAAKMYVQWLSKPNAKVDKTEVILDIEKLLDEAGRSIREISFKLNPHILQNYGVIEAVKAFTDKLKQTQSIVVEINSSQPFKLDKIKETIIYRILCECINNTLKHANATKISINFEFVSESLSITYSDNGTGFDIDTVLHSHKGIGLLNMQSRIKSINGQLTYRSTPGKGMDIFIKIDIL